MRRRRYLRVLPELAEPPRLRELRDSIQLRRCTPERELHTMKRNRSSSQPRNNAASAVRFVGFRDEEDDSWRWHRRIRPRARRD